MSTDKEIVQCQAQVPVMRKRTGHHNDKTQCTNDAMFTVADKTKTDKEAIPMCSGCYLDFMGPFLDMSKFQITNINKAT